MGDPDTITLPAEERDAFLGTGGVGVLSFSTGGNEPPHAVPVSYGYDTSEETFYFRLAVGPDTGKETVEDRPVTFVTYGEDEERGWWSVVAAGRLESLDEPDVATDALDGLDSVQIPLVDIFGAPTREVPFEFVRLVPESLTARQESATKP